MAAVAWWLGAVADAGDDGHVAADVDVDVHDLDAVASDLDVAATRARGASGCFGLDGDAPIVQRIGDDFDVAAHVEGHFLVQFNFHVAVRVDRLHCSVSAAGLEGEHRLRESNRLVAGHADLHAHEVAPFRLSCVECQTRNGTVGGADGAGVNQYDLSVAVAMSLNATESLR